MEAFKKTMIQMMFAMAAGISFSCAFYIGCNFIQYPSDGYVIFGTAFASSVLIAQGLIMTNNLFKL